MTREQQRKNLHLLELYSYHVVRRRVETVRECACKCETFKWPQVISSVCTHGVTFIIVS